jgi:hypothetical protein
MIYRIDGSWMLCSFLLIAVSSDEGMSFLEVLADWHKV